ncbi:MAG: thiamine pyrophosphate-binding protein [Rubrivivax sp.]
MSDPSSSSAAVAGARLLARTLQRFGVREVFHIPGEGLLEILDALADEPDIGLTTCRHEGGMAYAAQGYARVSGRPGVCLAARAPGALNAVLALHTADTDAVPLILVVGQAALADGGGDALSGPDLGQVFQPLVKGVLVLTSAARIPEVLSRAWHLASSDRMGPVVILAPEDVMQQTTGAALLDAPTCTRPAPAPTALADWQALSANVSRPLLLVGGTGWTPRDLEALHRFVQHSGWPVAGAYRRADLIAHEDQHFVGELGIGIDPALSAAVGEADLVVALGMRLGEINTFGSGGFGGYRLLELPRTRQRLVHVHADARELQRSYQADLAILSGAGEFLEAAWSLVRPGRADIADWCAHLRAARQAFVCTGQCPGPVDLRRVMESLREALPSDCPVCVGAGAYATWLHRYFSLHRPATLLGPKSGAMGYGLAAAIGAARARPGRPVVALAGDGCLLMHGEELATAVQYGLPIVLLVVNNASYGAIEGAQRHLFGRAVGTRLQRLDFAAWARSHGAAAEVVRTTEAFAPALSRALQCGGPAVVELAVPDGLGKPR